MFFSLEMGDSFLKPFGSRFSFKMVVEKFPHPYGVVLAIRLLRQPVVFAHVLEHDDGLFER